MDHLNTYYAFPRNSGHYATLSFPLRKLVVANDGHRESIDEIHIYIGRLAKASLDLISIKLEILA